MKHRHTHLLVLSILFPSVHNLSFREEGLSVRRDLLWKVPFGALGTYAYGRLACNALSVHDIRYPKEHESRIESTITASLLRALPMVNNGMNTNSKIERPLRVLEVGIGKDYRLLRRGLYNSGFHEVARHVSRLELTGLDFRVATKQRVLEDTKSKLIDLQNKEGLQIKLDVVDADIMERQRQYRNGYFDCIICCLTLCSVQDPIIALQEIKRLLRPDGGTFGYIEHVAVDPDDGHPFLEMQQKWLAPIQQKLADNCHLHRYTEDTIRNVFQTDIEKGSRLVQHERFYVDNMWPVSCQCCGVIQRIAV
jgi:SAM-dependent methyltransferase